VDHGTENADAYELFVKANEYLIRQTKEGFQHAIQLLTEAIALDPNYANAYRLKANALASLFGAADQDPALLTEAESLAKEALRIKPTFYAAYYALAHVYLHQGKIAEAEAMAKEFIRMEPENYLSHFSLAYVYGEGGQCSKSIEPFEEAVRLRPDYLENIFNLAIACDEAGEKEKCVEWASFAVPRYERYLKLHPDDEARQVAYASLLYWCGRREEAVAVAERMSSQARDGFSLFNTACLFGDFQDHSRALDTCRKAIKAGFHYRSSLLEFLNYDVFIPLHETSEYKAVREMVTNLPETMNA
jgi:tetratricopeptide (TPR) repeat protein